jgi:hypothetical protein
MPIEGGDEFQQLGTEPVDSLEQHVVEVLHKHRQRSKSPTRNVITFNGLAKGSGK